MRLYRFDEDLEPLLLLLELPDLEPELEELLLLDLPEEDLEPLEPLLGR